MARKKIKFSLPLSVQASKKKKFILNLNQFRNTHFRTLNSAKGKYHKIVKEIAPNINYKIEECEITYEYYHGSRRLFDIANTCSIVDKFCCDALTDFGYWDDDNSSTVKAVHYVNKTIDKENPRCEVTIDVIKWNEKDRGVGKNVPKKEKAKRSVGRRYNKKSKTRRK